jgi:Ca2+-binding RTX toxin-like protein
MALVIGKKKTGETLDYADGITDGADQIIGNDGKDIIKAGGGNDIIKGGGGADEIDGGLGRDAVTYEDSTVGVEVSLVTGKGKGGTAEGDTLKSIEDVYGSQHDDKIVGNTQDNSLYGLDGNDTLKGGGGADYLSGGDGNDVLEIDGTDDTVDGGEGIDTLVVKSDTGLKINLNTGFITSNPYQNAPGGYYHHSSVEYGWGWGQLPPPGTPPDVTGIENVIGSAYNDAIYGTNGANNLSGGNGDDILSGFGGDDVISGGNGNDIIFGGLGADTLGGGEGSDTFVFSSLDASEFTGGKPQDVITDFQQGWDKIDMSHLDFALNELLVLDNQNVGGVNYSYVGIDSNNNGIFDEGEFAVAVKMANGAVLNSGDLII